MRRRRQKLRCDADDTHGELFPTVQELTVRESVENPPRYTKKTPKIVKVSMRVKELDYVSSLYFKSANRYQEIYEKHH